jgi:hypothetical protein
MKSCVLFGVTTECECSRNLKKKIMPACIVQQMSSFISRSSDKGRELENVRHYCICQTAPYIRTLHECKFDLSSVLILLFVVQGYEMEISKCKVELLNTDFVAVTL